MKKIFLLSVICLLQIISFAHGSMLRIRENRGRTISVVVDGRRFQKMARVLTIGDLPAGMHRIKVYAYNVNGYSYRNGTMIYAGTIETHPGKIYYCSLDGNGMAIEENCCLDNYGHWNQNDNWDNWDSDNNCWNNNQNWKNDDRYKHDDDYYHSWNNKNDNDNWRKNSQEKYRDQYNDHNWDDYAGMMSNGRFDLLIEQIRKASFESSKVSVANTGLKGNKISVDQLIRILREFTFESTKLDFAKNCYRSVTDKKNYFLVNDTFTFQSSKDDLNEFLTQQ